FYNFMDKISLHNLYRKVYLLKGIYIDNTENRKLGRVGQVYGKQKEELKSVRHGMISKKRLENMKSTASLYKVNGSWTSERQKLHNEIEKSILSNKPSVEKPKAILLMGGGGSGKSFIYNSYIKDSLQDIDSFVYLNSDDIKEKL